MVSFTEIQQLTRTPGVLVEIDSSRAVQGPVVQNFRGLMLGQKRSAGSATVMQLVDVTSAKQAEALFGAGSQLARMCAAWFLNNPVTQLTVMPLTEPGGATASGQLAFTVSSPAAGTLSLYVVGTRVQVPVATSTTQNGLATATAAAINAITSLPVTASAASNVVTVTAKQAGTCGNAIDIRLNYNSGEATPAGVTCAITNMANGTTDVSLAPVWALLKDAKYNVIVVPCTDATNLSSVEAELDDRWHASRALGGVAVTAARLNHAGLAALGNGRNSKYTSILDAWNEPLPPEEKAAAYGAVLAYYAPQGLTRPFQTLPLKGILPAAQVDQFTRAERDLLLRDGISTTKVVAGVVQIERAIATYQVNAAGADDTSYLDLTTAFTNDYARESWINRMSTRFARVAIADDGTRVAAGVQVVTPGVIKGECIALYREWEDLGIVEDAKSFAATLIVVRNASDPTRVDVEMQPNFTNPLVLIAGKFQFRL